MADGTMLDRIAVAVETVVLGLWAGAMACFAFLAAPNAFRIIPSMSTFSEFVGATIRAVGVFGAWTGGIAIVCALLRAREPEARRLALIRGTLAGVALAASAYESRVIIPHMDEIAASIGGPIDSVPKTDERRVAYDEAHQSSSRVYGIAFLCVAGALALVPFGRKAADEG